MENEEVNQLSQPFSIKEFLQLCLSKWVWILSVTIIFGILGLFYVLKQPNKYEKTISVLVKDQESGSGISSVSDAFSNMGLVSSNSNVNNELIAITSPAVMTEAVKILGLDIAYTTKGKFHDNTLYGSNQPYVFSFPSLKENEKASLEALLKPDGSIVLSDFTKYVNGEKIEYNKKITCKGTPIHVTTPIGEVIIMQNPKYRGLIVPEGIEMKVTHRGMESAVNHYQQAVAGTLHNRDASVIDLKATTVSQEIDTDLLNTIIDVYNQYWVEDKNKVAMMTSQFINDRLKVIESELGKVDSDIYQYKSDNLVPDLNTAATMAMNQTAKSNEDILNISNQLSMAKYVRDYVSSEKNSNSVIPVNTGIGDMNIESQIYSYNNMLLDRNNLLQNSSTSNPVIQDYDTKLQGMRQAIVSAISNRIVALNNSLGSAQFTQKESIGKISTNPKQAEYLLSVERQQKVKESLYLYLLQKREENEITQTFTAYNIRIITPPTGPSQPVSPRKMLILAEFLLFGFLFIIALLYVIYITNTKVKGKKDLENLQAPFVGEIPAEEKVSVSDKFNKLRRGKETPIRLVVKKEKRDAINEAYKLVRSNLEFMDGNKNEGKGKVIMTTSFNPQSGKSFFSLNMAATYALKGKKVLLIDSDLRHNSVSLFINSPAHGLVDFLSGETDNWTQYLKVSDSDPNLVILPVGIKPPNPLELIENGRFEQLVAQAKESFDYIIIDCPPYDIVADTREIAKFVDSTVFVIRAGLFEKSMINDISKLYYSKKYPKMRVVLNYVKNNHKKGYHYNKYYNYYR